MLLELRQALITYQDYHMLLLTPAGRRLHGISKLTQDTEVTLWRLAFNSPALRLAGAAEYDLLPLVSAMLGAGSYVTPDGYAYALLERPARVAAGHMYAVTHSVWPAMSDPWLAGKGNETSLFGRGVLS